MVYKKLWFYVNLFVVWFWPYGFGHMAFRSMVLGAWFWVYDFGCRVWLWADGFGCMALAYGLTLGIWFWVYGFGCMGLGVWFDFERMGRYGFGYMALGVWFWAYGFRRMALGV